MSELDQIRANADALESWFKSMDEQRRDWTYQHGVEANARDALGGLYRLAVSVVEGLRQAASAIEAATAGETATEIGGSTVGESAVGVADAPNLSPSPHKEGDSR